MYTQLALDLQLARRKAGLTQAESATILHISRYRLGRLEKGSKEPTLKEIIRLSLLYGRSFEAFFADHMQSAKELMWRNLSKIKPGPGQTADTVNRERTLARLDEDLDPQRDVYGV
ncbi:MAG: helix-turn-helix transcriptional regulator [Pseudomonadota bacterium]